MTPTPPQIKICGLTRPSDALLADEAGAAFGGVILAPGTRRTVTPDAAHVIFRRCRFRRVGVFVDAPAAFILAGARTAGLSVAQLHGEEPPELAHRIRSEGVAVWKAVRVRSAADVERAIVRYTGAVDALLLDAWSDLARGGTGTTFDWAAVAAAGLVRRGGMALVLAGGLTPENVAAGIRALHPDVVDVSSGVESAPGVKDPSALRAFVEAASAERLVP